MTSQLISEKIVSMAPKLPQLGKSHGISGLHFYEWEGRRSFPFSTATGAPRFGYAAKMIGFSLDGRDVEHDIEIDYRSVSVDKPHAIIDRLRQEILGGVDAMGRCEGPWGAD